MMWNLLLCPDLLPPCLLLLQLLQLLLLFCSLFPPLIDRFLEMRRYDGVAFTNHLQLLIKLSFLGFIPARKNLFSPDGPIKSISSVKRISIKSRWKKTYSDIADFAVVVLGNTFHIQLSFPMLLTPLSPHCHLPLLLHHTPPRLPLHLPLPPPPPPPPLRNTPPQTYSYLSLDRRPTDEWQTECGSAGGWKWGLLIFKMSVYFSRMIDLNGKRLARIIEQTRSFQGLRLFTL